MNYKNTLYLPISNFLMKANLHKTELNILNFWNYINIYKKTLKNNYQNKTFIINDGPPYANGNIHLGHSFNKIIKDIILKFKKFENYNVNYIIGWDCHGLPIELKIEKYINKYYKIITRNKFRLECKIFAKKYIQLQKKSFYRLGITTYWNKTYKTMQIKFENVIIDSIIIMLKKKFLYSGIKPIYWCIFCISSLSESEIEYNNKQSNSIYVSFLITFFNIIDLNLKQYTKINKIYFLSWTTTPWTLFFNECISLNDTFKYKINKYYKIYHILINKITNKSNNIFHANYFKFIIIINPIYNKKIKIIFSKHITKKLGTGIVHIAPGYGYDDYLLSIKNKLKIYNSIDIKGYFYRNIYYSSGINTKISNIRIINLILKKNNKIIIKNIKHRYSYCWRHKIPIIYRTIKQIFIKNKIKNKNIKEIKWIPNFGKYKINKIISKNNHWCISRQRTWGIPILFLIKKKNHNIYVNNSIITIIKNFIKKYGSDIWYLINVNKLLNINTKIFKKNNDVLDVWYDSSNVYKYIKQKYNFKLPLDICIEGTDQYRGWFQASIINSILIYKSINYKTILVHGFILDKKGKKMSKSLNNVISPLDITKTYGSDILRLLISITDYYINFNISNEIINNTCKIYIKIRNVIKFMLSNINNFIPYNNIYVLNNYSRLNTWILNKTNKIYIYTINNFKKYNFCNIYNKIYNLLINEICNKYLEITKEIIYLNNNYKTKFIIYYIINIIIKIISCPLVFTGEEIWNFILGKKKKTIFLSKYTDYFINKKIYHKNYIINNKLFKLKNKINKVINCYKITSNIGTNINLILNIFCNNYWLKYLFKHISELIYFFSNSKINLIEFYKNKFINHIDIKINNLYIKIEKSIYIKCKRCWKKTIIIKNKYKYINICKKCIKYIYIFF